MTQASEELYESLMTAAGDRKSRDRKPGTSDERPACDGHSSPNAIRARVTTIIVIPTIPSSLNLKFLPDL